MMHFYIRWQWMLCLLFPLVAQAHEGHDHGPSMAVSLALTQQQQLMRVSVKQGWVQVDQASVDAPLQFSRAIHINTQPQKIATDGDARPKIIVANNGNIYVTWTQLLAAPYSGYIWFSRSQDGGKSFSNPIIVHQDRAAITHRFDAMAVSPSGRIFVAWVDKRDLIAAKQSRQAYDGAAIYYAISDDDGATFRPEQKLADQSCECCRIAIIANQDNQAMLMWRHLFEGGVRDHAMALLNPELASQTLHRATFANWKIDACPHHGPALAQADEHTAHMAWFDGGEHAGIVYARMNTQTWQASPTIAFGHSEHQAGHAAIVSHGQTVWLAWKEITTQASVIYAAQSLDGGRTWSNPALQSQTADQSDYPQLLLHAGQAYLAWNTKKDGLIWKRVMP